MPNNKVSFLHCHFRVFLREPKGRDSLRQVPSMRGLTEIISHLIARSLLLYELSSRILIYFFFTCKAQEQQNGLATPKLQQCGTLS